MCSTVGGYGLLSLKTHKPRLYIDSAILNHAPNPQTSIQPLYIISIPVPLVTKVIIINNNNNNIVIYG